MLHLTTVDICGWSEPNRGKLEPSGQQIRCSMLTEITFASNAEGLQMTNTDHQFSLNMYMATRIGKYPSDLEK